MSDPPRPLPGPRIAFDARYVRDSFGGIGRFAHGLLRALADAAPDHTLLVYYDPRQLSARYPLSQVFAYPNVVARPVSLPLYSPHEQALWPRQLRRDRADLFYSPYFGLPLLARVPMVCTVHDLIFERFPAYAAGRWVRFYYRPMMRLALRRAAGVFAVSESTKRDLTAFYGLDPRRATVVSEAADPRFRYPLPDSDLSRARALLDLPERYVLVLGARRPHKNLGVAVRACAAVQAQAPHWLVVVGRPEARYRDEVAEARAELGPTLRLRELPAVPEAELPALYAGADALLMPSLHEGFGLPALEAMACGTPVVAGNRAALPEVVGDAGLLVDPSDQEALADALRRVLLDASLAGELRMRGLARAAAYTWPAVARAGLAAFDRLLAPAGVN